MKRTLYMLLLIVAALVIGGLIGDNATIFPWLGYSKSFQFMPDSFIIDTDVLKIAFGLYVKANVCQVLLLLLAMFVYYKTAPKLIPGK